jgi:hypothetical protein
MSETGSPRLGGLARCLQSALCGHSACHQTCSRPNQIRHHRRARHPWHREPRIHPFTHSHLCIPLQSISARRTKIGRKRDGGRTDVVVLGCTHYPLLTEEIAEVAPEPVIYIDPSPDIARRVADVAEETPPHGVDEDVPAHGTVILTSARGEASETLTAYGAMGFPHHKVLDLPV